MRSRDWLLLVLLSVLWGGTFFFVAVALKELPPLTLVWARCLIATAALAPLVLLLGFKFPNDRQAWRDFAVMSVMNNIIPFSLIFWAQKSVPSGLAAVLNATTPLMSILVMRAFTGAPVAANKIAGVLIGIAGVATLIGPEALGTAAGASTAGMLAILAATLSYGFSGLWGRRLSGHPPLITATGQLACSTLMLLPIAAFADRFWLLSLPSVPVMQSVVALALLSTALAYILFFEIMRSAGPLNVMLVTLLIPFTSIALGVACLGEVLTVRQVAGAIVIGLSLLVIDGRLLSRFGLGSQQK